MVAIQDGLRIGRSSAETDKRASLKFSIAGDKRTINPLVAISILARPTI